MVRRPAVLIVTLAVLALAFSTIVAFRYLNRSDELRHFILNQTVKVIPGDLSLGSALIEGNTLQLTDIDFAAPDSGILFRAQRLSVRIALTNLVRYSGGLERVVQSVSLVEPHVIINLPDSSKTDKKKAESSFEMPDLRQYAFLDRFILRSGTIKVQKRGEPLFHAWGVEGWILGARPDHFDMELACGFYEDTTRALKFSGMLNTVTNHAEGKLTLQDYSLHTVKLPSYFPVQRGSGVLNISGIGEYNGEQWSLRTDVSLEDLRPGELALNEDLPVEIEGGQFDLNTTFIADEENWDIIAGWDLRNTDLLVKEGPKLEDIRFQGEIEEGIARVSGSLLFEGDKASFRTAAPIRGEEGVTATATIAEGSLGRHLGTFAGLDEEEQPQGDVSVSSQLNLDRDTGAWNVEAVASSPRLDTPIGGFKDVKLRLSLLPDRKVLSFDTLSAEYQGLKIVASGAYQPDEEERFVVDVDVSGDASASELPDWAAPLERKAGWAWVKIRQTREEGWTVRGEGKIRTEKNPTLGEFSGYYGEDGFDLDLQLYSLSWPSSRVHVWRDGQGPIRIEAREPQIFAGWWDPNMNPGDNLAKMSLVVSATVYENHATSFVKFEDMRSGAKADVYGTVKFGKSRTMVGDFSYSVSRYADFIGNGELRFRYGQGMLDIDQLSFMDYFWAHGRVDVERKEIQLIDLQVEGLDISEAFSVSGTEVGTPVDGNVNGRVYIRGSFERPTVSSHWELSDGRYGDLEGYWGILTLETDSAGEVFLRQGAVGRAGRTIFTLFGSYNIPRDEFDLFVETPGSDANSFTHALIGKLGLFQGQMSLSTRITGSLSNPSWKVMLSMHEAKLSGIRFSTVNLVVRGETTARQGLVIYLDDCSLERPDHYALYAEGKAPMTRGAGEINISFEGDILEVFPQWSTFFETAEGMGQLNWRMTIVDGRAVATRGHIRVKDGNMTFRRMFADLDDIDIDISLDADGRANINRFDGVFANRFPFTIRNDLGDVERSRRSIDVDALGLSAGVLKLKMDHEDGIPIHVPDLFPTPDYGRIKLAGKDGDAWFRVAGPLDSLYFDGSVFVSRSRITFPPEEEKSQQNGRSGNGEIENFALQPEAEEEAESPASIIQNAVFDLDFGLREGVFYEKIVKGLENAPVLGTVSEFFGQVALDINLEPTEPERLIDVTGSLGDESLRLNGKIVSTRGTIDFLDWTFNVERAEVLFDNTTILPVVSMRASTTVMEGDFSRIIYLTLYVIDPITGERTPRGRWGEFTFVLEDQAGSSQTELLSAMGLELGNLQDRVIASGVGGIDRAVARRYLRPVEQDIAQWVGLDLVRVHPTITQNLLGDRLLGDYYMSRIEQDQRTGANPKVSNVFRASEIVFGKYLTSDVFVTYSGQLGQDPRYTSVEDYQRGRLGLLQTWGMEYRFSMLSPNLVLESSWEYDIYENNSNRSGRLRYNFLFDLTQIRL